MKASGRLLKTLRDREQLRLAAYLDSAGVPTIGYGTTHYGVGKPVKMGDTCTPEQAEAYFRADVAECEKTVNSGVRVELNQNQFDALVMFVYNTGTLGTGLKQALNAGDFELAAARMAEWKYVTDRRTKKKSVCPGLIARRNEEIAIFNLRTA